MTNRTLPALAWTVVVVALCLCPRAWLPGGEDDSGFQIPHKDKAVHAALFGGYGFLWARAGHPRRRVGLILASGLLLAVGTELAQGLPAIDRDPDVFDALADAVGLVAGIAVARPGLRLRRGVSHRGPYDLAPSRETPLGIRTRPGTE